MTYDALYARFDSALMQRVRADAYDEDIGQHSWVSADELREDAVRLALAASSHVLDLGCGPGGPLTFLLRSLGCRGTGLDVNVTAVELARARAEAAGVAGRVTVREADLDDPLPLDDGAFDAALSVDVVLHLHDRGAFFREVRRVLAPGARFLFTDAGVLTGAVSDADVAARSANGPTQLVAPGFNERALEAAGLAIVETGDRTDALAATAAARLGARAAHRSDLEQAEGPAAFALQQHYLETVVALARRRALSRFLYLAERA